MFHPRVPPTSCMQKPKSALGLAQMLLGVDSFLRLRTKGMTPDTLAPPPPPPPPRLAPDAMPTPAPADPPSAPPSRSLHLLRVRHRPHRARHGALLVCSVAMIQRAEALDLTVSRSPPLGPAPSLAQRASRPHHARAHIMRSPHSSRSPRDCPAIASAALWSHQKTLPLTRSCPPACLSTSPRRLQQCRSSSTSTSSTS